jgi:trehalose-phosphatase
MSCAPHQATVADSFCAELAHASSRLLLLDYDGTLAPFYSDRYKAFPYQGVTELLQTIMGLERTRIVLVSGRRAAELPPLLGLSQAPEIWGSHGLERLLPDGTYKVKDMDDLSYETHAQLTELLVEGGLSEQIEVKPGSIARPARQRRMRMLRNQIAESSVSRWYADFIRAADRNSRVAESTYPAMHSLSAHI